MELLSDVKFYLNSVSSDTVGLYVDTLPVPDMAQMRYSQWTVGADEDRAQPDWTFEDIEYSITAYQFKPESLSNTDIHKFLQNPQTLQLSILEGVYFKIRSISVRTTSEYDNMRIRYDINLTLAPFRYATVNDEITLSSGDVVEVGGNRYAKPIFKVTVGASYLLTQSITLSVNGQQIQVNLADNAETVIDSDREVIYSGNNLLYNNAVGKFPLLSPGQNLISWTATLGVTTVKMIKNERWY